MLKAATVMTEPSEQNILVQSTCIMSYKQKQELKVHNTQLKVVSPTCTLSYIYSRHARSDLLRRDFRKHVHIKTFFCIFLHTMRNSFVEFTVTSCNGGYWLR